ncbi:MAG: trypsin-like peptidase domain-containing protein [Gemmatimonadota bacterium]
MKALGGAAGRVSPAALGVALALLFLGGLLVGFLLSPGRTLSGREEGLAVSRTGAASAFAESTGRSPAGSQAERSASSPATQGRNTPLVRAVQRVSPSVVSVIATRRTRRVPQGLLDLFFEREQYESRQSLGSGFPIDSEGYLLTNHHVVRDADSIRVIDAAGRIYTARLVGSDELTDIAVLKVPDGRVPPAPIGTSRDLMVGEPAIALGNPTGFDIANAEATVTSGVISGVGRDIRSVGRREVLYADMVQTDAAINPGNSGGPLVNANGQVVGVNSAIFSRSGGSEGLGFAIPIDRAMRVADELRRFGRIRRPWVGIDVASERSDSLFVQAVVRRVAQGSPADRAGIREGDVVVTANGKPIRSPLDWEVAMLDAGVNGRMALRLRRDGRLESTVLGVEEIPSETAERVEVLRGMQLVTVTPQIAVERRLQAQQGALIVEVSPSVARSTLLRPGDVIVAINQREVRNANDAAELFRYYSSTLGWVRVWILRGGSTFITRFGIR